MECESPTWSGTPFSLMTSLMRYELTVLLQEIFLSLPTEQLLECRLVCHEWKSFVDRSVLHSVSGRREIERRLDRNWARSTEKWPYVMETNEEPFDLVMDKTHIFCGSSDKGIEVFDRKDLHQCYSNNSCHNNGVVQLRLHEDNMVVSVGEDARVNVFRRSSHNSNPGLLQPFLKLEQTIEGRIPGGHRGAIWGLAVDNAGHRLFTGSADTTIHVFRFKSRSDEDLNLVFERELRDHGGSVSHLEVDGDYLLSGSADCTLKLWSLSDLLVLHTINTGSPVLSVALNYPLLVSCPSNETNDDDDHGSNVSIYRMKERDLDHCLVRKIPVMHALDISLSKERLAIAYEEDNEDEDEEDSEFSDEEYYIQEKSCIVVYKLSDLSNDQLKDLKPQLTIPTCYDSTTTVLINRRYIVYSNGGLVYMNDFLRD